MILSRAKASKNEFVEFLTKYNVVQLAVGVVIGTAVKDLVNSIANNLIMPLVGLVTPSGNWQEWVVKIARAEFNLGLLLSSFLDFLIVAVVVFVVLKKILNIDLSKRK